MEMQTNEERKGVKTCGYFSEEEEITNMNIVFSQQMIPEAHDLL